jgi:hypothetical protein
MKKRRILLNLVVLGLIAVSTFTAFAALSDGPEINWSYLGSGGGRVVQGSLTLDSAIGQPVTGDVQQDSIELCSGYICGTLLREIYLPVILNY